MFFTLKLDEIKEWSDWLNKKRAIKDHICSWSDEAVEEVVEIGLKSAQRTKYKRNGWKRSINRSTETKIWGDDGKYSENGNWIFTKKTKGKKERRSFFW